MHPFKENTHRPSKTLRYQIVPRDETHPNAGPNLIVDRSTMESETAFDRWVCAQPDLFCKPVGMCSKQSTLEMWRVGCSTNELRTQLRRHARFSKKERLCPNKHTTVYTYHVLCDDADAAAVTTVLDLEKSAIPFVEYTIIETVSPSARHYVPSHQGTRRDPHVKHQRISRHTRVRNEVCDATRE